MITLNTIDWNKVNDLLPAIIQCHQSGKILMLGYMNRAALEQTIATKVVTFYSRSKQKLWVKGETSGNYLQVKTLSLDCDQDALLIQAEPMGPTCHLGTESCFSEQAMLPLDFIIKLEKLIKTRHKLMPENSYTTKLFQAGIKRIAQKVGEEGVEVALAAMSGEVNEVMNEAADLFFHLLVLLEASNLDISAVIEVLERRQAE